MRHRILSLFCLFLIFSLQPRHDQPPEVTLALLGDIMLGRGVAAAHRTQESWETALRYLAPHLASADLALANLESPITMAPLIGASFDLRAAPLGLQALAVSGLDLLSVANNHIMDSGQPGLEDTQAALRRAGLTPLGPGLAPVWRTVNGLRLAFLAFDDVASPVDLDAAVRAVTQAKEQGALPVVSIHWGREFRPGPEARQEQIAQALANAGVVLIWGHHPHVLQPLDWVKGEGRPGPALVAYSLGNALFDQLTPPDARRSALILVRIGATGVKSVKAYPFWIDPSCGCIVEASPGSTDAVLLRLGDWVTR